MIDKQSVDSFLSTSSRTFFNEQQQTTNFSQRLWISTTNKWTSNAAEAIKNQRIPVIRLNLYDLEQAPVDWQKMEAGLSGEQARLVQKTIRKHQIEALDKTHEYFKSRDRGKLIMACGTGKTFTTLKIAEKETDGKGLILVLVPSIALIGQTLREWTADAKEPINPICICSDPRVSQKIIQNDETDNVSVVDLALPASTNVKYILHQFRLIKQSNKLGMTVVFSTYQSIDVIAEAQKSLLKSGIGFHEFDLIICDEAHRTTGVTLANTDESAFVKVHDNDFIKAKKRIYMTATPRLYSEDSKSKAAQNEAILCSMDDTKIYGDEIYRIGFGEAVERDLLTDYKVLILTINDSDVSPTIQSMLANGKKEINTDDVTKLIGVINALSKQILGDEGLLKSSDPEPMKRAVAFCQSIKISKSITNTFNDMTEIYLDTLKETKKEQMISISAEHVDGTMSAPQRDELLGWLKNKDTDSNECRVLTNVRCLSEGVDVPSLDAVMFLSARNSQVDVVQSVGRVMRKAPNKKYGYIIIPVVIPSEVEASKALDDNQRFKVVWTVLNALRAHDDRFNAIVNKIDLNQKKPTQIIVGGVDNHDEESKGDTQTEKRREISEQLTFQFQELQGVVFAKMVKKVGDRFYWEQWAKDVAVIAERQIERISNLIKDCPQHKDTFDTFLKGLQNNINPSITEHQAVEMLAQHIITKPIFEALFENYSFVKSNAISTSMQTMLDLLEGNTLEKESDKLQKFYESVRKRAEGIDNAEGKQRIIIELYDKFFKTAFPKMVEQLGIVYTPVEIVDFIIHSVNDVLQKEFGRSISDENVHILDPFTGTGTFITRLLQSGLIHKKDLFRKYTKELHANEIVLLAYYIAAVNIENAFHDVMGENSDYKSFDGIVLTDTFQMGESDATRDWHTEMFTKNSVRVEAQKKAPIKVIMGNPPYSIGQKSANDNAQNQKYEKLDARISNTYAKLSTAGLNKSLYDAYIKAFRWSTDRLDKNGGIIAFVSNGGWLEGNSTDGFRKIIEKEFSSLYVINLRGNGRTSGERCRQEGEPLFAAHGGKGGSLTPITIIFMTKKPNCKNEKAKIFYHDIGMYLKRKEKLKIIKEFASISNTNMKWKALRPNEHGDWLNQRSDVFDTFIPMAPEKKFDIKCQSFFSTYAIGVATNRDAWVYNFSINELTKNMKRTIDFYNEQLEDFKIKNENNPNIKLEEVINSDSHKISWTVNLKKDIEKWIEHSFKNEEIKIGTYRPFIKQRLYFDKPFIERPGLSPRFFPTNETYNLVINCHGLGGNKTNSSIITNTIIDLNCLEAGSQGFPLYYYEERKKSSPSLFDAEGDSEYIRKDGVSDFILERAKKQYGKNVGKEDIFYYVYGILHSPDYRSAFANDLKKMLPRIPLVEDVRDFWKFSKAGRELADLHIHYESVPPAPGVLVLFDTIRQEVLNKAMQNEEVKTIDYRVQKMRFPKKEQKDKIIYNSQITIENIPAKAYEYVVNGKSAIEWIMERYQIKIDKNSGIKNDPNDWSEEVGNPRYILDLLLSIINVSMQTVDIVNSLPKLSFEV
jgi:predicted helicase